MPYESDAQRRWAHTDSGMKALGGPAKVAEWDSASKGMDLPERKIPFKAKKSKEDMNKMHTGMGKIAFK